MSSVPPPRRVLIIDDDEIFSQSLREDFSLKNFIVHTAATGKEGLALCSENEFDIVLLDQNLPDMKGDTLCQPILSRNDQCKIIFITAYPSFSNAVKAIKQGAYDYLSKPVELAELHLSIKNIFNIIDLEKTRHFHYYWTKNEKKENRIIGNWGGDKEIPDLIHLAASVRSPVLLTGETGTGKSMIAKNIHYNSPDKTAPFISLNCAALPESLIEAELFGYEKGAFTGAVSRKKGLFEIADGGTILLDEIGSMPLHLQSKLLGILDDNQIRRVGGHRSIKVNVRIIAATNSDLERMIEENLFREDLFYRISVLKIHIPPLRNRVADIPELCRFFISRNSQKRETSLHCLSETELENLKKYHWPGNIRELKNIIERSIILHKTTLSPSRFINGNKKMQTNETMFPSDNPESIKTLETVSREYIDRVLERYSGNYTRTAKALGISLSTLKRKMKARNH